VLSKTEAVWRHLLVGAFAANRRRWPSVTAVADELGFGLSTVHRALSRPVEMGAILISARGLRLVDPARLLLVWAGRRTLRRDVLKEDCLAAGAPAIELALAQTGAILGGFGAVVAHLESNTIAGYDTVLVYREPSQPLLKLDLEPAPPGGGGTNLMVLEADSLLSHYGTVTPLVQAYVDLFNLPGWQAGRFVAALTTRMLDLDVA